MMMLLSGERISWLIVASNASFEVAACSAARRARISSRSYARRSEQSNSVVRYGATFPSASLRATVLRITGSGGPSPRAEIERDLADRPLHRQQRHVMSVVEDPPWNRQRSWNRRPISESRATPSHAASVSFALTIVPSGTIER